MVRLTRIEPKHPAPEAGALSTELQAQIAIDSISKKKSKFKQKKSKKGVDKAKQIWYNNKAVTESDGRTLKIEQQMRKNEELNPCIHLSKFQSKVKSANDLKLGEEL